LVEARKARTGGLGVLAGEPLGRPAHGERLEREPHLEQVAQVVDVEVQYPRALVRDVLREAESLELPQRRAGRQLAEDDRLPQLVERVLGHRPVAGLQVRHGAKTVPYTLIRCQTS